MSPQLQPNVENTSTDSLTDLIRQIETLKGYDDLYFLSKFILGYKEMDPQPHLEMCDFITTWQKRKKMMLVPRGCFKTSVGTIAHSVQRILQNPDIRILIASETYGQAKKFLSEIKGHFESEKFKEYYGDLKRDKGWNEEEITVNTRKVNKKEPTVSTAGIDVTKTGMHYDLIIVDDPHSQKNITNAEQIAQVKTWYKLLLSMLEPSGQIMVIGTKWDFSDLYAHIEEELSEEYAIYIRQAGGHNKELFFPTRLTQAFLDEQLKEQGNYIYNCQYNMTPVPTEDQTFRESDIQYYDVAPISCDNFVTCDPSMTEDEKVKGDSTAICVVGIDEKNDWYARHLTNAKLSTNEIIEALFEICLKYKPKYVGIESITFQKLLKSQFEKYCLAKGYFFPIEELKAGGRAKELRIKSLQPIFEQKKFYMPKPTYGSVWELLRQQLLHFPRSSHDDAIDALAYVNDLAYFRKAAVKQDITPREKRFNERMETIKKKQTKNFTYITK